MKVLVAMPFLYVFLIYATWYIFAIRTHDSWTPMQAVVMLLAWTHGLCAIVDFFRLRKKEKEQSEKEAEMRKSAYCMDDL